ncbi:5-hydroxyisourate hydrolase [Duganella sp. CF402]|uniref:hydroxyisourate hydrolase n=1 Tax=unclassified Duganella TaxID=2636909 RepID=UPI0008BF9591|nr:MULTISPECIES: hydroxyisourate hydrolase [unclassified Duganella]RZT10652.1 5-hydroxyisourate hydrolase [Duganella sp. BK701]SEL03924.1 5-hydroxyisourate hydrolase [Duganella sp. CF402]
MHLIKTMLAGITFASFTQIASAQANPLSVHVLNLVDGLPSADVVVTLEKRNGEQWTLLNSGVTNEQGRIAELFPKNTEIGKGVYRVTFKTEKWFAEHNSKSFFPEIPVIFNADGSVQHYHIPLLLSQYGYSTYRGN